MADLINFDPYASGPGKRTEGLADVVEFPSQPKPKLTPEQVLNLNLQRMDEIVKRLNELEKMVNKNRNLTTSDD